MERPATTAARKKPTTSTTSREASDDAITKVKLAAREIPVMTVRSRMTKRNTIARIMSRCFHTSYEQIR